MEPIIQNKRKRIIIKPGEYCVTREDTVVCTLLGSCVSVCLYDPLQQILGMNHFLHSRRMFEDEDISCFLDPGRHGVCAMDSLINGMLDMGAKRKNLRAKIFGGGSMFRPFNECSISSCVGKSNIDFAMKYLRLNRIYLAASDTGGDYGRVIRFSSGDYYVYVKKIRKMSNPKIIARDQEYWDSLNDSDERKPVYPQRIVPAGPAGNYSGRRISRRQGFRG